MSEQLIRFDASNGEPTLMRYGVNMWAAYGLRVVLILLVLGTLAYFVMQFRDLGWVRRVGGVLFACVALMSLSVWSDFLFDAELFGPDGGSIENCFETPMRWWTAVTVTPGESLDSGTAHCVLMSRQQVGLGTGIVILVCTVLVLLVWSGSRVRRAQRLAARAAALDRG